MLRTVYILKWQNWTSSHNTLTPWVIIPARWVDKRAILNASYVFKCRWVTEVWFLGSGNCLKLISVCYFVTVANVANICMVSVLL
jgi:hypothetical protein